MKQMLLMLLSVVVVAANGENVLQVKPTTIITGPYNAEHVLEISLTNTEDVANLQFDMLIPDGITLLTVDSYIKYTERTQIVEKDDIFGIETTTNLFSVSTNKVSTGYTRFVFTPTGKGSIAAGSGTIMKIPYAAPTMADGIYPIKMHNIRLDKSVTETIVVDNASSYVVVGANKSPAVATDVDLSGMTDYIPSFVVEALNSDIKENTNLRCLNLSGTTFDNLGASLMMPANADALWYTSDRASLNRTYVAGNWSTICLPFVPANLSSLKVQGCQLKALSSYDDAKKEATFIDVDAMETGVPYLIKCSDTQTTPFVDIEISNAVSVSTSPNNVTKDELTMCGTYRYDTPSSDAGHTIYGYNKGEFVALSSGSTGKVQPFRAYLSLEGTSAVSRLSAVGLDDVTGVSQVSATEGAPESMYTLKGIRTDAKHCKTNSLIISGGKKIIMK